MHPVPVRSSTRPDSVRLSSNDNGGERMIKHRSDGAQASISHGPRRFSVVRRGRGWGWVHLSTPWCPFSISLPAHEKALWVSVSSAKYFSRWHGPCVSSLSLAPKGLMAPVRVEIIDMETLLLPISNTSVRYECIERELSTIMNYQFCPAWHIDWSSLLNTRWRYTSFQQVNINLDLVLLFLNNSRLMFT